jgi:hypothetical protein
MVVFVEDIAESITATDAWICDSRWIGDRFGEWAQWSGVGQVAVWSCV